MLFSQEVMQVGVRVALIFVIHFMLMVTYAIIAECQKWPMPLDFDYFIGRVNIVISIMLIIASIILIII